MKTVDVGAVLAQGLAAHQAGRLSEAESRYRRALKSQPGNPDALHLLGMVALQSGRPADAAVSVRKALAVAPGQASFWNTLGVAQRAAGQVADALGSFERAVTLDAGYVDGWRSLAETYQQQGDLASAAVALERVTTLQPGNVHAWSQRSTVAYLLGQLEAACEYLTQWTALDPENAEAWSNLGVVQQKLWRLPASEASQRRALAIRPDFLGALNNLGSVLVADSRWDEAATVLQVVVERSPDGANGWLNLGHALLGLEQFPEALAAFDRTLSLDPTQAVALIGRGDALLGLSDQRGAILCYEQAAISLPNDIVLYEHLGVARQGLGHLNEAIAAYRRCIEIDPACDRIHSGVIFALDLVEEDGAAAWDQRMRWNASIVERTRHLRRPHTNRRDPDRPLRIGYISADFRRHSAGFLALPVLRSHDRSQVAVHCYSGVVKPDDLTERFKAAADVWHDVQRLSDDELDALIRADEIDVLMDLSGHSAGNRLPVLAREPAPVQATAWGYATGTGLDTMHYFLADAVVVPPEAYRWYAEEVVNLPSLICYEPPDTAPPVMPPPSLTRGHITFGAFNRLEKVTDNVRDAWARVMAAVPDAKLLVKAGGKTEQARWRLVHDLVARGVARERIEVHGHTNHVEHLAAHAEIDILLDSFPHGGGVTSIEALLMGVPVVTVLGERVPGRLAASFLTTLGMTDLIAETEDDYLQTVVRLAGDRERLVRERGTLRERVLASPIANAGLYTRALEATYRELWERWCRKEDLPEDLTPPAPQSSREDLTPPATLSGAERVVTGEVHS
jgi:protein O-GlcNAc transferase